jgi:hypothetical protein
MHDGIRLADGSLVRLEAARVSGRWLTSEPALQRFIAAQTPLIDNAPKPVLRTQMARQRASQKAAQRLEELGI